MFLSDEKMSHLAHRVLNKLKDEKGIRFKEEDPKILREIKRVFASELKLEEEMDRMVREKLKSYSRQIIEGSQEWEVMYQKAFEEELKKRRRA